MNEYERIVEYILSDGRVLSLVFAMLGVLVFAIVVMLRSYTKTQLTNNETTQEFMKFITAQTGALSAHLNALKAVQDEIAGLRTEVPKAGAEIKQVIADWQSAGSLELHRVSDSLASKIAPILAGLDDLRLGVEKIHLANCVQERALEQIVLAINASRDALLDAMLQKTGDTTEPSRDAVIKPSDSMTVAGLAADIAAQPSTPTYTNSEEKAS